MLQCSLTYYSFCLLSLTLWEESSSWNINIWIDSMCFTELFKFNVFTIYRFRKWNTFNFHYKLNTILIFSTYIKSRCLHRNFSLECLDILQFCQQIHLECPDCHIFSGLRMNTYDCSLTIDWIDLFRQLYDVWGDRLLCLAIFLLRHYYYCSTSIYQTWTTQCRRVSHERWLFFRFNIIWSWFHLRFISVWIILIIVHKMLRDIALGWHFRYSVILSLIIKIVVERYISNLGSFAILRWSFYNISLHTIFEFEQNWTRIVWIFKSWGLVSLIIELIFNVWFQFIKRVFRILYCFNSNFEKNWICFIFSLF